VFGWDECAGCCWVGIVCCTVTWLYSCHAFLTSFPDIGDLKRLLGKVFDGQRVFFLPEVNSVVSLCGLSSVEPKMKVICLVLKLMEKGRNLCQGVVMERVDVLRCES